MRLKKPGRPDAGARAGAGRGGAGALDRGGSELRLDGAAPRDDRGRHRLRAHQPGAGLRRRRNRGRGPARHRLGHQQHPPAGGHRRRHRRSGRDLPGPRPERLRGRPDRPRAAAGRAGQRACRRGHLRRRTAEPAGRRLGAGPAAAGAIRNALDAAFVSGLDRIVWVAAIAAALGALLSALLLGGRGVAAVQDHADHGTGALGTSSTTAQALLGGRGGSELPPHG